MTEATAVKNPVCFGTLYDAAADECKTCKVAEVCSGNLPVPVTEDTITTELEEVAAEAAAEEEIIEVVASETKEALVEAEAAAVEEIATPVVKAKAPKAPKVPKEPSATREITSIKSAAFKKDADGKFILVEGEGPFDLIVNAGDIVENINPKSKHKGMTFKVSCYSKKYECFRGTALDDTKKAADFSPREIKVIS